MSKMGRSSCHDSWKAGRGEPARSAAAAPPEVSPITTDRAASLVHRHSPTPRFVMVRQTSLPTDLSSWADAGLLAGVVTTFRTGQDPSSHLTGSWSSEDSHGDHAHLPRNDGAAGGAA